MGVQTKSEAHRRALSVALLGNQNRKQHGESSPGGASPEYVAWQNMRSRCERASHPKYPRYGGRGIRVCARWASFTAFLADVGRRPSAAHSLDRIDNDGAYEPGNVQWATRSDQQRNKSTTRLTAVQVAEIRTSPDSAVSLAHRLGVNRRTVDRIRRREAWNA